MRLNRFLAAAGFGSRRHCEELVVAGRVTINGRVCQNLATEVTEEDFVKVGGKRALPEKQLYVLLHKPRGYLSTASDTHRRRTVFDLLPAKWPRLFHVGRLDMDSEGLLLLTNDGDLALRLTHPRYKMEKEYEVTLDRPFDAGKDAAKLLKGMRIEGGQARVESIRVISTNAVRVILRQGIKRQIRLMLYKLGYEVERLVRTRVGTLKLDDLRSGDWRFLTTAEVKSLQATPLAEKPAAPRGGDARPHREGSSPADRPRSRDLGALSGRRRRQSASSTPRGAGRP